MFLLRASGEAWGILALMVCQTAVGLRGPQESVVEPSDTSDVTHRFLAEYGAAFERLQQPLSNARCTLRRIQQDYHADGTHFLKDGAMQEVLSFDADKRIPDFGEGRVECFTNDYVFRLTRPADPDVFVVKGIAHTAQMGPDETRAWNVRRLGRIRLFAFAAYQIDQRTVADLLADPTFRVTRATTSQEVPERVTIGFSVDQWTNREDFSSGEMTFIPDLDWALGGYTIETVGLDGPQPYRNRYTATIECQRWGMERYVFPRRVDITMGSIFPDSGAAPPIHDIVEYQAVEFGSVGDEQFLLSAFGLPNHLLDPSRNKRRDWLPWLLTANVAILAVAALMLYRRRSKSHGR